MLHINCYTAAVGFLEAHISGIFSVSMCQSCCPPLSPTQRSMEHGVNVKGAWGRSTDRCGLKDSSIRTIFVCIIIIIRRLRFIFPTAAQLMQHFPLVALPVSPAVRVLLLPVTCIHETQQPMNDSCSSQFDTFKDVGAAIIKSSQCGLFRHTLIH